MSYFIAQSEMTSITYEEVEAFLSTTSKINELSVVETEVGTILDAVIDSLPAITEKLRLRRELCCKLQESKETARKELYAYSQLYQMKDQEVLNSRFDYENLLRSVVDHYLRKDTYLNIGDRLEPNDLLNACRMPEIHNFFLDKFLQIADTCRSTASDALTTENDLSEFVFPEALKQFFQNNIGKNLRRTILNNWLMLSMLSEEQPPSARANQAVLAKLRQFFDWLSCLHSLMYFCTLFDEFCDSLKDRTSRSTTLVRSAVAVYNINMKVAVNDRQSDIAYQRNLASDIGKLHEVISVLKIVHAEEKESQQSKLTMKVPTEESLLINENKSVNASNRDLFKPPADTDYIKNPQVVSIEDLKKSSDAFSVRKSHLLAHYFSILHSRLHRAVSERISFINSDLLPALRLCVYIRRRLNSRKVSLSRDALFTI